MIRGDRIRALLASQGKSQADLARAIGVSAQAVSKIVNGGTTDTAKLYQIARFLGTSPEYLTGESDDDAPKAELSDKRLPFKGAPPERDTVELDEYDVSYGLGGSYIHDVPVTGKKRVFSRSWIRQFTDSPMEALFWATGNGPSMMPAILDQDILLIDTMNRTPRTWDKYWALDMHGMGMIKSLRPAKDGAMRIISINPDFREEIAYDGEMNVVGRVVAIVRKV